MHLFFGGWCIFYGLFFQFSASGQWGQNGQTARLPLPSVIESCLLPFRFGENLNGDPHPKPKSVYEYFTLVDVRKPGIAIVKLFKRFFLLAQEGLITLKDGVKPTDNITALDVVANPKNLTITPVQADLLTSQLKNSQAGTVAVINGNYAIGAGLKIAEALATENATGDAAQTYANIIAVKSGNENSEKIKALVAAPQSDAVKQFIQNKYNGAVVAL